jgi:IS5 family transposase
LENFIAKVKPTTERRSMSLKQVYQLNLAGGLLQTQLRQDHELVILAERMDWEAIENTLKHKYSLNGRKAKRIRLMVGLHILKHRFNISDETVCQMLQENIYFRFLCGVHQDLEEWKEEKLLNACTMSRFRKRLGADGMKLFEDEIKRQLKREGRISGKTQVVDTTAMEKNIAYPTDTNLLARGMQRIVKSVKKLAKKGLSVSVRSYQRLVRKEILRVNKLGRGRADRIATATKNLVGYAKKISKEADVSMRAVKKNASEAELAAIDSIKKILQEDLEKLLRVIEQAERRQAGEKVPSKAKILSMHEPNVCVIAKGKRRKRYEFGVKISLSMDRNGYVVGHQEYQENEADVNTLDPALEDWKRTFGDYPEELGADRGYTANNPSEALNNVRRVAIPKRGRKRHEDHDKAYFRRVLRLRNCIEPTIGHLKTDHRVDRCRYRGKDGDTLNIGFAATAWNLKKWANEAQAEKQMTKGNSRKAS